MEALGARVLTVLLLPGILIPGLQSIRTETSLGILPDRDRDYLSEGGDMVVGCFVATQG